MRKLFSFEEIDLAIYGLSHLIENDLDLDEEWYVLVIMNGAFMFAGNLLSKFKLFEPHVRFVDAKVMEGMSSKGEVTISNFPTDLGGRVLVLEDIVETGRTLNAIHEALGKTREVRTAVLVDKPDAREVLVGPNYVGFTLDGNPFPVGFGMDLDRKFIGLRDIWEIERVP